MEHSYLISVIVPTKNEENTIKRLIKSIKKQTYKNYEILIGDYSTDNTPYIARKLGAKVYRATKPGPSAGRNIALKHAKGDIIAFIDSDIILSKDTFEKVVETFKSDPSIAVVKVQFRPIWSEVPANKRRIIKIANYLNNFLIRHTDFLRGRLMTYACVFCRGDLVRKVGYFREDLQVAEDAEFFTRLGKYGRFVTIDNKVGFSYRRFIKKGILRTVLFYAKGVFKTEILGKNNDRLDAIRIQSRGNKRS